MRIKRRSGLRASSRCLGGDDERWPYGLTIDPQGPGGVLEYASAMDREHCARLIARTRLHTCHSDRLMSLNVIEKVTVAAEKHFQRAAFAPSDHNTALTRAMARPFTVIESHSREVALVRESHFRLSLTVSPRPFLLQVTNFALCSTSWHSGTSILSEYER